MKADATPKKKASKMQNFVALVGLVTWGWAIWFFLLSPSPEKSPEEIAELEAKQAKALLISNAQIACSKYIKRRLNNPDSVEWVQRFSWPVAFDPETGRVQVSATYRAANAFGGIITEQKYCVARLNGEEMPEVYELI